MLDPWWLLHMGQQHRRGVGVLHGYSPRWPGKIEELSQVLQCTEMVILWIILYGDLLKAVILWQLLLYHHKPTFLQSALAGWLCWFFTRTGKSILKEASWGLVSWKCTALNRPSREGKGCLVSTAWTFCRARELGTEGKIQLSAGSVFQLHQWFTCLEWLYYSTSENNGRFCLSLGLMIRAGN